MSGAKQSPRLHGLSWATAGESHGPCLIATLEGLPYGMPIDLDAIRAGLRRRWEGPGRGLRAGFEKDELAVLAGVKLGQSLGTPLVLQIGNSDTQIDVLPQLSCPRPGHADLPGVLRHKNRDVRAILERASARETAARTALGEVARQFLALFGIQVRSQVESVADVLFSDPAACEVRIDAARQEGDSLGGVFTVVADGCPPGLGGYAQPADRLDARLMGALATIPSVKGVEVGLGFSGAGVSGRDYHDEIRPNSSGWAGLGRLSNSSGGIEGGLTTGESICLRAVCMPIPTLRHGVASVDLATGREARATYERSDVCVIEAAAVVAEGVLCLELASALLARLGGVTILECKERFSDLGRQESVSDWPMG